MTHWELPMPHVVELSVQPADIGPHGHVNNSVSLTWLDRAAWSHSGALGVPLADCLALRRGMAAQRIEIEYLRAAGAADQVGGATWIVESEGRVRDRATLALAGVDYVCINLDSGRAVRMPESFMRAYVATTTAGGA